MSNYENVGILFSMLNEYTGLLIAFDGIDSSGKNTQVKHLVERLRHTGHLVHLFETPDYNTPSGQTLKKRLQNKDGEWHKTAWEEKMRLFAHNRLEHRAEVMEALQRGDIVVYDRYVASSLAFITVEALDPQSTDLFREEVQAAVARHEYQENHMPQEDVSIFLDVAPDISAALLEARKQNRQDDDEYTDHLAIQNRLYNEYDYLCLQDPHRYVRIKCVAGDHLLGVEDIAELVWEELRLKFPWLEHVRTSQ